MCGQDEFFGRKIRLFIRKIGKKVNSQSLLIKIEIGSPKTLKNSGFLEINAENSLTNKHNKFINRLKVMSILENTSISPDLPGEERFALWERV